MILQRLNHDWNTVFHRSKLAPHILTQAILIFLDHFINRFLELPDWDDSIY